MSRSRKSEDAELAAEFGWKMPGMMDSLATASPSSSSAGAGVVKQKQKSVHFPNAASIEEWEPRQQGSSSSSSGSGSGCSAHKIYASYVPSQDNDHRLTRKTRIKKKQRIPDSNANESSPLLRSSSTHERTNTMGAAGDGCDSDSDNGDEEGKRESTGRYWAQPDVDEESVAGPAVVIQMACGQCFAGQEDSDDNSLESDPTTATDSRQNRTTPLCMHDCGPRRCCAALCGPEPGPSNWSIPHNLWIVFVGDDNAVFHSIGSAAEYWRAVLRRCAGSEKESGGDFHENDPRNNCNSYRNHNTNNPGGTIDQGSFKPYNAMDAPVFRHSKHPSSVRTIDNSSVSRSDGQENAANRSHQWQLQQV